MKKKQLAKLKKQFRPSFNNARALLFREMEKQAMAMYELPVTVGIKLETPNEMSIEFLGETTRDQIISVPLDEHFNLVVKRIQSSETGLLEHFSRKLVNEFANYWGFTDESAVVSENAPTPAPKESPATEVELEAAPDVEVPATATQSSLDEDSAFATFKEAITAFPKFEVIEHSDSVQVVEKTAKEERLLATISTSENNVFTIEPALERKYKLKLEVIPVIETFAQSITPA